MSDWQDLYQDLGREIDVAERGMMSMERDADRMIKEIYELRRENAELRRRLKQYDESA